MLAVRNLDKGNDAKGRITAASPDAVVTVQELDLTIVGERSHGRLTSSGRPTPASIC